MDFKAKSREMYAEAINIGYDHTYMEDVVELVERALHGGYAAGRNDILRRLTNIADGYHFAGLPDMEKEFRIVIANLLDKPETRR